MLAARASTRNAQRIARSFATVADSAGLKVAAVDYNQPTSAVTFLVKAGSRFESKPGVAHALKNFAFKSTAKRSAIGTVRESELYGGVLSASLGREHLALTAEFLRGDEEFFVDVLSSFVTSAKYTRHEFEEYVAPVVEGEVTAASADPATQAIELAHALAFRSGLGSSLFAPSHNSITAEDIKSYAKSAFTKGNIAVIGTGIDPSVLTQLVEKSLGTAPAAGTTSSPASSYFGGESRTEAHGGPQTVFIGFGVAGVPSAELAVLAAHLSPEAAVKWSQGLSPIAAAIPQGTSVQSVYLPYSDATLVGLLVQGGNAADVKAAGKAAVQALKSAASGISAEELKKAVAKAKFAAASAVDSRDGLVSVLGSKVLAGSTTTLDATLSSFDGLTATAFKTATSALLKGKPTRIPIQALSLAFTAKWYLPETFSHNDCDVIVVINREDIGGSAVPPSKRGASKSVNGESPWGSGCFEINVHSSPWVSGRIESFLD
ncbi:Cytochrome b-c1 complex subunit 2, mitochondrial [Hypsizygus marmoreus]|uniref:Cytochrome b-c1 complex subunit 2, mitochondrial n=1 Tax=Hypsizygus marmoreus TaxID=39966 RepID=A0A369JF77_HYPMA|nr:Cytochrome b-c1 complex subunit 2, mitochondrial [Hypsizygus marmoreus]